MQKNKKKNILSLFNQNPITVKFLIHICTYWLIFFFFFQIKIDHKLITKLSTLR